MERLPEQIVVGVSVALVTALINQAFAGNINYWLVLGGFLVAVIAFGIFQRFLTFPFGKFRVTNVTDGKGLIGRLDTNPGELIDGRWQFKAISSEWAVYGPYLRKPVRPGRYRVIFRLKINNLPGENRPIVEIDVASSTRWLGDKRLAARTITTSDFRRPDEPHDFPLYFHVLSDERDLEFRMNSFGHGDMVVLYHVAFSRMWL